MTDPVYQPSHRETPIVEAANTKLRTAYQRTSGRPTRTATSLALSPKAISFAAAKSARSASGGRFMKFILGSGKEATDFVHEHGRKDCRDHDARSADHR